MRDVEVDLYYTSPKHILLDTSGAVIMIELAKRQTRRESGTQSHGPLLSKGGGRAAERRIEGMSAAHKNIPIGIFAFRNDRERPIRTKPVHEHYGRPDRRRSAYVEAA